MSARSVSFVSTSVKLTAKASARLSLFAKKSAVAVAIALAASSSYGLSSPLSSTESQQLATKEILSALGQRHFVDLELNNAISERFLNNYIERLDPNKVFFLQSDIEEFSQYKHSLDDDLKLGDNSSGFLIYSRLQQRMTERLEQVIKKLDDKTSIDFSADETLPISDDDVKWPQSSKEADEQWRKRIKSFFLGSKLSGDDEAKTRKDLIKRYTNQLERIQKNNAEDIYEIYINSFTELYDPHTNYLSPRSSENFSINMSLSLEGIGAVLQTEDEYTKIIRLVTAGPAHKAGELKAADRITAVAQGNDGEMVDITGWRLDEVVNLIRGPKGSIVRLRVVGPDENNSVGKEIQIKRDTVKLEDQAAQKAVIDINENGQSFKVGVINIPTFYLDFEAFRKRDPNYRSTTKDVRRLISELQKEDVDGIVIDLRNNGGGSLYEATSVTDLFIDQGPVVQIGKDGGRKSSQFSQNKAAYRGPLLVLINRLSASASEIFAGAIQDYNRGLIVGSQSFGKGTVQTLIPLKSQGELKITESKFYRVSGESTQHRGVVPDIRMPEVIDTEEVGESSYDTALEWSKTQPVRHGDYRSLKAYIPSLDQLHQQRIGVDPDFVYINDRKALVDKTNERTLIQLNEAKRLEEKAQFETESLAIENKRRQAKQLKAFATHEELIEFNKKQNEERAANAGTTTIDTSDDAILKESSYILKDLVKQSKKVAGTLTNK